MFKRLEEERLDQLCSMSKLHLKIMENNRPKLVNLTERLREPIELCNVSKDVQVNVNCLNEYKISYVN